MKRIYIFICIFLGLGALSSCEDFFTQESDDVLYADKDHLSNAEDSIYSVTGILTKLQALADRTILLGELRGDLVDLTNVANNDLREIFEFNISDDNKYNTPSDYYAVINNCNYFIAHADTLLRDNRNQNIFMKEYCAIKAIRAWTYLQTVLNYGNIPFFTEPLLSKEQAEFAETAEKADLQTICTFFINDLSTLPERYNTELPGYRDIRGLHSKLLFFPLSIIRAELYLWRASVTKSTEDYKQAALHYYKYISERNGSFSAYPTTLDDRCYWSPTSTSWSSASGMIFPISEGIDANDELITMIAGDSIRAEGHYSELRNFFTSREENDYKVSVSPSARLVEISESQENAVLASNGMSVSYAPKGLDYHLTGDLRLQDVWYDRGYVIDEASGERIKTQSIYKYSSQRNVHLYRRTMVYLRMAEALNMAGYPRMAFQILSEGLSNAVINKNVLSRYYNYDAEQDTALVSVEDSLFLAKFNFDDNLYGVADNLDFRATGQPAAGHNQMGIHARGCGFTPMDTTYVLIHDTIETNPVKRAQLIAEQQAYVDSLILNEAALEFAFEGTRYYDFMRYAMRQTNPGATMAKLVCARRGKANSGTVQSEIKKDLTNPDNWYMKWKNKIGK